MKDLAKYNKYLIALLGIVLTGVNVLYGNNPNVQLLISAAVATGVYQIPNRR